jgi:hypothetical protein
MRLRRSHFLEMDFKIRVLVKGKALGISETLAALLAISRGRLQGMSIWALRSDGGNDGGG